MKYRDMDAKTIKELHDLNKEQFREQWLKGIKEGAYFKVSQKFEGTGEALIDRILNASRINVPEDMEALEKAIDERIKRSASGKEKTVYGVNIPNLSTTLAISVLNFQILTCADKGEKGVWAATSLLTS